MAKNISLPEESIFKKIIVMREQKVLLDSDLAELYGVPTKVLKQAVRRNMIGFPMILCLNCQRKNGET